ncbi:hypothetical protein KCU95_g12030, partial [Aureobasidium melanogenum]
MCLPTETLVDIASRLPNLRHVEWQIADGDGLIQRRQNRSDFANQLLALKTLCPSLTTLEFVFRSPFPSRNPITEVPSVLLPYSSVDHLCVSLRKLCQSMQRVVLTNLPISSQLFWPLQNGDEAGEEVEPFWPKLTHFDLEFSICAAEGGLWTDFLTLPSCSCRAGPTNIPTPDEKQQPERPAHTTEVPSPPWPSEELEDLLLVIAKAIARMPLLQVFGARVGKSSWRETLDLEDHGFGMRYSSPVEGETGIDGAILAKRLEWTAPSEWRMSTTLEEQWRSILGDTGVVEYLVWYTDAAIDTVAHIALHDTSESIIHYQECVMFTALVKNVKNHHGMNDEQIVAEVDYATSDLAHTVHSLLENNVLPTGCYLPYSEKKPTVTSVAFACNPLESH